MIRSWPQEAHRLGRAAQTVQHQSCPRRWKVRSCLPHSAHSGGEMLPAPALRRAMSRSATTRGAGERPSVSTVGLSSKVWASRRRLARASGDAAHRVLDGRAIQPRLDAGNEVDNHTDRIGEHVGSHRANHRSAAGSGDPTRARLGRRSPTPASAPPAALDLRAAAAAATGSTSSSIVQSKMSSSAINTFRLNRSGRSTTVSIR